MWKPSGHTRSKLHLFDVVCLVGDDVRLIVQTLFNVSASDIALMCLGHFIAEYQTNKQACCQFCHLSAPALFVATYASTTCEG